MQATEEAAREREAGAAGPAGPALCAMPDAEIKDLFISLIDPTAMARTGRCIHIAELIGAYSAGAGWDRGVRLARMLADIYGDMSKIADRPTTGGAYWLALRALGDILAHLRRVGRAYRDGLDADPMEGLEEVRSSVAKMLDSMSGLEDRKPLDDEAGADPDFPPELAGPKRPPQTCGKALMRSEWELRKRHKKRGVDHVFPPKARTIVGMLSDCVVPGQTSLDLVQEARGRGRP